MGNDIKLEWRQLVDAVRAGDFEPEGESGLPKFLFSHIRNVFISDPYLVKQILQARQHRNPFMLIGEFGTGKNVFLELVARGNPGDDTVECIDENVNGTQEEMLEKFFGVNGLVEQHPGSLFHFDLLQNAIEWPLFIDKVHELARRDILYRTDGKAIRNLGMRVVGGATVELEDLLNAQGASSAKYLYEYLATNQLARTSKLIDQRSRIQVVLSEVLAAQLLDSRSQISEEDIVAVERIPTDALEQLEQYHWPDGFYEIVRLVRTSLTEKRWVVESLRRAPMERLKVFVSYSSTDLSMVGEMREWLVENNVDPWVSAERLLPGQDWELEINKAIYESDAIVVCLSGRSISKAGYAQTEIKRALDLVERIPEGEIYLIPVRLEPFKLSRYQYVDFFQPEGRSQLMRALRNRASTLGKAPPGSRRYIGTQS